jgi:16S rRNA (cytosine967-C5)-methyltransferase
MPEWNELVETNVAEKMRLVSEGEYVATGKADKAANGDTAVSTTAIALQDIFPWKDLLSDGIDYDAFCASFLVQPALFLRLRPGKTATVQQKLATGGIGYTVSGNDCLTLANASKTDEVIAFNKEAVVQDYSSQRIGEFLEGGNAKELKVWDCCAASGGKSILAYDKLKHINLTVSDVRESIIANLRKRFAEAGITQYKSFVADISIPDAALPFTPDPDLIIADVPCSGSGTWSRTPEQLYYFDTAAIERYSTLQKKIVSRVVTYLKSGGQLLYITCSAFKKENEDVVDYLQQEFALEVIKMEVLKGYDKRADTMFAALLKKA